MHMPSFVPEILTTKTGPFFIAQFLRDTHLLSALHSYSDTLSVHSMDISLIPLYLYKIPKDCSNVLLTATCMYTTQKIRQNTGESEKSENNTEQPEEEEYENKEVPSPIHQARDSFVNAIGVIGCSSSVLRIGEDSVFIFAFSPRFACFSPSHSNPTFILYPIGFQHVFHVGNLFLSR